MLLMLSLVPNRAVGVGDVVDDVKRSVGRMMIKVLCL